MQEPLILIDAFSQIFRCFYAVRHLSNSRGEPTNAMLPFGRILLGLERSNPGMRGAMVFDCGRVAFRQELNPAYKANRPPMPEELKFQVPVLREMAAAFGWPLLEALEYEADDLIAALALHLECPVQIISSDKDLAQLVDDRVAMLIPGTGSKPWELRDRDAVRLKFNVEPEQMVDYLSLLGDTADNIPGVAGIGPKTAAEMLKAYGSIDAMLANPERIENVGRRAKIEGAREILERNRALIRLKSELPEGIGEPLAACGKRAPDWAKVGEILKRYELKSLLRELPEAAGTQETQETQGTQGTQGDLFGDLS